MQAAREIKEDTWPVLLCSFSTGGNANAVGPLALTLTQSLRTDRIMTTIYCMWDLWLCLTQSRRTNRIHMSVTDQPGRLLEDTGSLTVLYRMYGESVGFCCAEPGPARMFDCTMCAGCCGEAALGRS